MDFGESGREMVLTVEGVSFPCMRVEVGVRNGLKSFGAIFEVSFRFIGLSVVSRRRRVLRGGSIE